MALLSALEKRSGSQPAIPISSGDPSLLGLFGGSNSNSGQNINADTALAISTVYACVNRRAKTLAMLPLDIIQRHGDVKTKLTSHRLYYQMSAKPNSWQTSFEYRMLMETWKQLRGNAYILITTIPGRGINELIPMQPDHVWPFVVTPTGIIYYMYDNSPPPPPGSKLFYQYFPVNSETIILPASDVLHIKGISSNGIVGKNVVQLMRESVGIAAATEEQGARLFSNGAQIGKVFRHPAKLSPETFDRLKSQLDKYSGTENAHKTIILEQGMDITPTTLTMEDAQFLDTRKFQVEDIASFLDVPLILINRSGDKNQTYASAEQVISIFITHQMAPDFIAWEQNLNQKLLYQSEINAGIYFRFDFDAMLRGDTKARAEYLSKRFNMGSMNPDEIRVYEDENPTGTKEGKEYYVQAGVQPVSMIGKMPVVNPLAKPVDEKPVEKPVAAKEDVKNVTNN